MCYIVDIGIIQGTPRGGCMMGLPVTPIDIRALSVQIVIIL